MTRWETVNGIYQIYPRSFKDSNGDGVGDLKGIIEKLDYIKGGRNALGIDAIWISPFFTSPMADFGYDVSNYCDVDPLFGTLDDFKELLAQAHARNIKVMIDYVPNHTSDQHPWFLESRSSRDNPKRDWYVWRDPKEDGSEPSNWLSVFGGSAWELDEATGQYYLHSFLKQQPDLNWDNPEVRKAMTDVLDFWLSMGVDGIRADAVRWISKDLQLLEDNPPNLDYMEGEDPYHKQIHQRSRYGTSLHTYLREMAETVAKYPDRIILLEDYLDTHLNRDAQYMGMYSVYPGVAAPFNFEGLRSIYSAPAFREFISSFEGLLGGELKAFYCFSNHDKPRLVSRVGKRQAKLIAMLQLTLPGIPVVYYGDELGMHNVAIREDQIRDPFGLRVKGYSRDPARTPMQWSGELNAGFSIVEPWLPVAQDFETKNVEAEADDPESFFSLYQELLKWRNDKHLRSGEYIDWQGQSDHVFGYKRKADHEELLIILNMSDKTETCYDIHGEVLYSTHSAVAWIEDDAIELQPHQGVIVRLDQF